MESVIKVLVVEDEPLMADFIARGLSDNHFSVDIAADGQEAITRVESNSYNIVLLDLRLPIKDGLTICRELRGKSFIFPILMLTALDSAQDVVNGLDSGADDYLAKPFDFDLLLARMRALLRRGRQFRSHLLQVADLSLNTQNQTVQRGNNLLRLTAKEYALLELLMIHEGQILGREKIAEHVWDENFDPLSNIIDAYIMRLRKKIDKGSSQPLIHTRRSEGYILSPEA